MYLDARFLVLSELVLWLDVVGSGHEAASGVSAISRRPQNANASRRTANGAWPVVNTRDHNEPQNVCLALYWMLFEYPILRDFSSFRHRCSVPGICVFSFFWTLILLQIFPRLKLNCLVHSKDWSYWGETTLFSHSTQLTLPWLRGGCFNSCNLWL